MSYEETTAGRTGAEVARGSGSGDAGPGGRGYRRRRRVRWVHRLCENLSGALLLFSAIFSPWAFGTTQTWSTWTMNITAYTLAGLLAMKWALRRAMREPPPRWDGSGREKPSKGLRLFGPGMALLMVLFLGYVLVGAVNARAVFRLQTLDFEYFDCISWLPHSYDRPASWFFFWEYLGFACLFWAARDWVGGMSEADLRATEDAERRSLRSRGSGESAVYRAGNDWLPTRLKTLLLVLLINGSLVGIEGVAQRVAGSNRLLFMIVPRYNTETISQFGPYANRNNASEYFNLLWPVSAGLACVAAQTASRRRREGLREPGRVHWWLGAGAIVMGACPIASSSRGGVIISVVLAPLVLAMIVAARRSSSIGGKIGLGLLFVAALQLAMVIGWDSLQERFQSVFTDDLSGRLTEFKNAKKMLQDFQRLGSGAGTFASLYFLYRPDETQEWAAYGHNDWLEAVITLGWTGFGLLMALLAGTLARLFMGNGVPLPRILIVTLWIALAGCLVHAFFDFPLRIHSVAMVFILYCSVLSCAMKRRCY